MHFFQGNPEGRNPVHIIIYIITERTGKCQEKIWKTTYDRKTESSQSDAKKGKNGVFRVPKERKKRKESCNIMQKFIAELQTMTVNKTKKSCNIMQKFIAELQTMTVNKTKNPAI